jgi:hypothetical protein
MRTGAVISVIGHVGAVMMTMLAWETRSTLVPAIGAVVPVEIVAVAPESNVRALAPPVEEDAAPIAEETVEEQPEPTAPAPQARPQPRQPADEFDLAAIARMVDKSRAPGRERNDGAASDRTQRGAGLGTGEVAAMEDRLRALARAHILRNNCWRMPVDLPDPDRLVITVQFDLNRNGTINGQPRITSPANYTFDPAMRTAGEAALRAVRLCDPFPFADDPVVGEHFEMWREMEYTFRPRL